jgi:hypothetical protein
MPPSAGHRTARRCLHARPLLIACLIGCANSPAATQDANASDANASDANASDANASDANASDANASDANTTDANASDADPPAEGAWGRRSPLLEANSEMSVADVGG